MADDEKRTVADDILDKLSDVDGRLDALEGKTWALCPSCDIRNRISDGAATCKVCGATYDGEKGTWTAKEGDDEGDDETDAVTRDLFGSKSKKGT